MKPLISISIAHPLRQSILTLLALLLATSMLRADTTSTNKEDTVVGEQVLHLLEKQDTDGFASRLSASPRDWQSVRGTNAATPDKSLNNDREKRVIAASAQQVTDLATRLGLDSSHVHFHVKEVLAKATGTSQTHGAEVPWAPEIKVILLGEPAGDAPANKRFQGEYELALGGVMKFPAGWRCYEGVRWSRFPDGVADAQTLQDLKVISKVAAHQGSLTDQDDPALAALGDTLIRFLQTKHEKIFTNEVMMSFDETWNKFEKQMAINAPGQKLPSRKELESGWSEFSQQIARSGQSLLTQADALGIDFSSAKITLKNVVAEYAYTRGGIGTLEGIDANSLNFTFNVESDQKSKSGRPISGDYKLAAKRGERTATRWTVQDKVRWEEFPKGLVGEKELADMKFENYVAEHDAMPPGTKVPDIEMVQIDNETKVKLSNLKGKVVVLDFWATWCGPCQEPMAHLQTLREHNPEWKDRVAILSLSIDDDLKTPREHLLKRGWTNSVNMWAGEGGWKSEPAKQFRVTGVPTLYIINPQGKVVQAGHFLGSQLNDLVSSALPK